MVIDFNANPECRITGKVKNLSSRPLEVPEQELMEMGPKFCPVEPDIDRARFQKDLNQGYRRMKIKDYFYPDVDSRSEEEKRFYVKNKDWEPPSVKVNKAISVHSMAIQNKFDQWKQSDRVKDNLSVNQRKALKSLANNEAIDIKLDDKSGSFVVADKKDYISAATNDLAKQSNIQEVNLVSVENLIQSVETEISHVIDACVESGEILPTTGTFIKHKVKKHSLAKFYCNWKTHKYQPTQTEFALAAVRGIVSCSGTSDENLASFLDFILNPGMKQQRAYLKGTKDFLMWMEEFKKQYSQLPPFFGFLTVDYCSMYPSMPDNLILPAVREYLESRTEKKPATATTLQLLEITQRNNYFEFADKVFQQVGGTSIGKKHAPSLCCLGAGKLEEDILFPSEQFRNLVLKDNRTQDESDRFFGRFIDDMLALMNGSRADADYFVQWLNSIWPGIKFTYEWSDKEITFLDVRLVLEG